MCFIARSLTINHLPHLSYYLNLNPDDVVQLLSTGPKVPFDPLRLPLTPPRRAQTPQPEIRGLNIGDLPGLGSLVDLGPAVTP